MRWRSLLLFVALCLFVWLSVYNQRDTNVELTDASSEDIVTGTTQQQHFEHRKSLSYTPAPGCVAVFQRYVPSALEKKWKETILHVQSNARDWKDGCSTLNEDLEEVNDVVQALRAHASGSPFQSDLLSAFEYTDTCSGKLSTVFIEPLISFLRHPYALCSPGGESAGILDKTYLLVPHQEDLPGRLKTKWLFDAGASTYDTGAGGASQSWFVNTYRARGIEFDRIFGWEAATTDPAEQWDAVPADVKRITSWYNIPVRTALGHADNPFTFIKNLTAREDYVVFKLDIDTPDVEIELVRQLMQDFLLLDLVDEFYFEHHVSGSPMQWHGWGNLSHDTSPFSTLAESYEVFSFLRHHGVRAHSWV